MSNYFLWSHRLSTPEISRFVVFDTDINNIYSFNAMDSEQKHTIVDPGPGPYKLWGRFSGYEDMRLVSWNGVLYGILSRPDVIPNKVIMQLLEFDDSIKISRCWFITSISSIEKSWLPIEDQPFTFLYDPISGRTVHLDIERMVPAKNPASVEDTEINTIEIPGFGGKYCGSSQVIRLGDRYICICHTIYRYYDQVDNYIAKYEHMFIEYDKDMNLIRISEPFVFINPGIEYCCGMCKDDANVYITFSCGDACSNMIRIPIQEFIYVVSMCNSHVETIRTDDYFITHINEFLGMDRLTVGMNFIHDPTTAGKIIRYIRDSYSRDPFMDSSQFNDIINRWLMQVLLPYPEPRYDMYGLFK